MAASLASLACSGGIIWKKEFGAAELFTGVHVDPLDRRHACLVGAKGTFIVLNLTNPAADKV